MTPDAAQRIREFNDRLSGTVSIELYASGDARDTPFRQFCETLQSLATRVRVAAGRDDGIEGPALGLGPRIIYRAVPEERELEPFLEALAALDGKAAPLPEALRRRMAAVAMPAEFRIYVAPQCPHCPSAVRQMLSFSRVCERVRVTVVDAFRFADLAASDAVRSVPTLIGDDGFRWTGALDLAEIVSMAANRDPAALGPASLKNMLANGEAGRVAQMMVNAGRIFPALVTLLTDEKWPVRLGAMVVAESVAETDPALAARIVAPLWERFSAASDTVRGDILHVLGGIGTPEAAALLMSVRDGTHSAAVREAADDALDQMAPKAG